jgi:hypothetical protein
MESENSSALSQEHATCPYHETDQSSPCLHPFSVRFILISFFHLRLSLPGGLCRSGIPTELMYAPHLAPTLATCPVLLIILDFMTQIICLGLMHCVIKTLLAS